jgi:hypothetical protein
MKVLLAATLTAIYLCILWGPSFLVAQKLRRAGDSTAFRCLRILLPSQLIATAVLWVIADATGLRNPAGLLAAITIAISVSGAAAFALLKFASGPRPR